jgi:hypothetical protein
MPVFLWVPQAVALTAMSMKTVVAPVGVTLAPKKMPAAEMIGPKMPQMMRWMKPPAVWWVAAAPLVER